MTHELANPQHCVQRVRFRGSRLHGGQHRTNPCDRADAAARRDRPERAIREDDQADLIVVRDSVLREARGDIRVVTEAIEVAGAQRAGTARVDREDDLEMLVLGEIAADEAVAACCRLPIDDVLRIARAILA